MNEIDLVKKSFRGPVTIDMLKSDLENLGVKPGMVIVVHSSLSSLGWVCGGPQAVVLALMDTVTLNGTIIMPTYTGWNSDPASWKSPAVPDEWVALIRDHMPTFDPNLSMTKSMGVIVECFRKHDSVLRSSHPRASFAACGKHAEYIINDHSLDFPFGENTPLARAYEKNAYILLIGTNYGVVNSWYLSAYRSQRLKSVKRIKAEKCYAAVKENGKRSWKEYLDYSREYKYFFEEIGKEFEKTDKVVNGLIGHANSKLMSLVETVDFGQKWMEKQR